MSEPTKAELEAAAAAHDQARTANVAAAKAALANGAPSTTYAVQPGDTLESIADAIYGDGDQDAHFLASAGSVISTDPSQPLPAGAVLTIPAIGPATPADDAADDDDGLDLEADQADVDGRPDQIGDVDPAGAEAATAARRAALEAELAELDQPTADAAG